MTELQVYRYGTRLSYSLQVTTKIYLILLLGEGLRDLLVGLLPVPLLVSPVERKGIEENDGRIVGVLPPIGDGLQVLDQLHHLVIVLPLGVKITNFFKRTDDCCFFLN
jgi:hypothetical protein